MMTEESGLDTPFSLGREMTIAEAITIARRATFDPGQFTKQVLYREGVPETLERWQARAVVIALSPVGVPLETRWSQTRGHFVEYEEVEIARSMDVLAEH